MEEVRCSLCGFVFDPSSAEKSCEGCMLVNRCAGVHCPRCGYVEVTPHRGRRRHRRRYRGQANPPPVPSGAGLPGGASPVPLSVLPRGAKARVVELDTGDRFRLQKFLALGLLPGVEVEVVRRFPCVVLNLGLSQIALDEVTASAVLVAPQEVPDEG